MDRTELISAKEFCVHHGVSFTFIAELQEAGIVEVQIIEEQYYINCDQASELERLIRLHNELDINVAGVEVIARLLQQVEGLQAEVNKLSQRLRVFEQ